MSHKENSQIEIPSSPEVVLEKYHKHWEEITFHKDVSENRYIFMLFLTTGFFLAELIVGLSIGSIVLQADSFHMLGDAIALIIGYSSLKMKSYEKNEIATYGYLRAEIIASLINSVFLLSLCFSITISAVHSFFKLSSDHSLENESIKLIIVASIGLFINLIGACLFHTHDDNINTKGVFLHILGDLFGSFIALLAGIIIIATTGSMRFIVDPIGSLIIVLIIGYSSYKLLRRAICILLHLVPIEINYDKVKNDILRIDNVNDIHNFHIWALDQKIYVSSVHIKLLDFSLMNDTIKKVESVLKNYNIHYNTIQIDQIDDNCNSLLEQKK